MEIKKVEEIYLDNKENATWENFYDLMLKICRESEDETILDYCGKITESMENLSSYVGESAY